jgi:CheY-like chemotaxis protein
LSVNKTGKLFYVFDLLCIFLEVNLQKNDYQTILAQNGKAADAGCRHYIIKPFKKEHLLSKIRETLEHEKPRQNRA